MNFEDLLLQIQYWLGKTFNIASYLVNPFSLIDMIIAFVLLSFAFYEFLSRIAPFRNVSKAVYIVIGIALASAMGLFGGFLFLGGRFVSFASIGAIAFLSRWETKTKLRFALTAWALLILFYSFLGSLNINLNFLQTIITALVIINILLSNLPKLAKIFLIIFIVVLILFLWPQIIKMFAVQTYS
jgi:hypothetical protein